MAMRESATMVLSDDDNVHVLTSFRLCVDWLHTGDIRFSTEPVSIYIYIYIYRERERDRIEKVDKSLHKQTHQLKQPYSDFRVKLDFTPDWGTRGNRTLGTFSVYCLEAPKSKRPTTTNARKSLKRSPVSLPSPAILTQHVVITKSIIII